MKFYPPKNLGSYGMAKQIVRTMKIIAILMTVFLIRAGATVYAQISLDEKDAPLVKICLQIKKQTGVDFFYNNSSLKNAKPVSIKCTNESLKEVLDKCFANQPLTYKIKDNTVVIVEIPSQAQLPLKETPAKEVMLANIDASGKVVDNEGLPMVGATILLKGTSRTTITDAKGDFVLANVPDNAVLMVRYIGYTTVEVSLKGTTMPLKIKLNRVASALEEVKVVANTGYQQLPKERATGSFDVISDKQIKNKIQTNVLERLEGLAPGLMMINGKDNGSDDGLTIRGVSTLYGTKRPLIVVDNFPIEGDISSINPNDVESITLLKDAAAASIWGARAANGVIVITTKRGKQGDMQFTYTNSFQFERKPDLAYLNRLNSSNDIDIERQLIPDYSEGLFRYTGTPFSKFGGLYLDSVAGRISPQQYLESVNQLRGLDNTQQIKDLLMQQPFTQNHSLAFSGGTDKNKYYGSINYTDRNGFDLKDQSSIYNVFLKSSHQISNKLNFGINVNLNVDNGTGAPVSALSIYNLKPYNMLRDQNGNALSIPVDGDPLYNQNNSNAFTIADRNAWGLGDENYYPLNELDRTEITKKNNAQRLQAELNYKITNGISLNFSYQLEKGNQYTKTYQHANQASLVKEINDFITPNRDPSGEILTNSDGTLLNPTYNLPVGGKINELRTDLTTHVVRGILNVDKVFATDHQISAIAGFENRRTQSSGNQVSKYGYDDNTLTFIDVDAQRLRTYYDILQSIPVGFDGIKDRYLYSEDRFVSAFANASYTYKNKYVYSGSVRIDQTNLFGTDPKYLYQPMWSSGLSWIMSNEDFLKDKTTINYLQLRTTYGLNGNIPKNAGPFMIATSDVNLFSHLPSNTITTPANNTLRWERTAVTNFGIDFALFKNRVSGKVDYYFRRSSDLLSDEYINPTLGFSTATLNTASMKNDGMEVQLETKNIVNNNFRWSTQFTYAYNKSKITKVALSGDYLNPRAIAYGTPYIVGAPYGALYSLRYGGLTPDNGQLLVKNAQGEIEPDQLNDNIDFAYYSGNRRPVSNGAIGNTLNYKNLELSFMFVFYMGHVARQNGTFAYPGILGLDGRLANAWKKPGDENTTSIPNVKWDSSNHYYAQIYYRDFLDVNVFNANYLKLREVILTYNVPQNVLRKFKYIKGLQLNAQARNLWTLTKNNEGIDPEAFSNGTRTMPIMATYAFGINLNF